MNFPESQLYVKEAQVSVKKKGIQPLSHELHFTTQAVYVLDRGVSFWSTVIGAQFGLLGMLVSGYIQGRKYKQLEVQREGKSLEQIARDEEKTSAYSYDKIEYYKPHKKGMFKIGNHRKFEFSYEGKVITVSLPEHEFNQAMSLFQASLGGRLRE